MSPSPTRGGPRGYSELPPPKESSSTGNSCRGQSNVGSGLLTLCFTQQLIRDDELKFRNLRLMLGTTLAASFKKI